MRRCLNCMYEYSEGYENTCPNCGYAEGVTQDGSIYLYPGSILHGRYIVGTIRKIRDTDLFYIGWDALFDRKVLIQEYFPKYCATRSGKPELSVYDAKQERFKSGLDLFYQQSRQLIRLYKEEDVITYHACFMENGTAYAVMDYRQEKTLKEYLEGRCIPPAEAEKILDAALEAVKKAHDLGVFHGQIEMDSLLMSAEGKIILKDFGASRYVSGEPGIADYDRAGFHTDIYSMTKLFIQMITGKEIEEGGKLDKELARKQIHLKKSETEALKHALLHQIPTIDSFYKELWGRRKISRSRKQKEPSGSLKLPRWVLVAVVIAFAGISVFTALVATGKIKLKLKSAESQLEKGTVRVPNVINLDIQDAKKRLAVNGLDMQIRKANNSPQIPENKISYQELGAGSQIERGSIVWVWVSGGIHKEKMPSVQGISKEEAKTRLSDLGFGHVTFKDSEEPGIVNMVKTQSIELDELTPVDQEVVLEVCVKPEETQSEKEQIVPDTEGKKEEEARKYLEDASFKAEVTREFSDTVKKGTVIRQLPEKGQKVNEGSVVLIYVSQGAEKVLLDNVKVQYQPEEKAKQIVQESHLTVGKATREYNEFVPEGNVVSWNAEGGASDKNSDKGIEKGSRVDLVISRGKVPEALPSQEMFAPAVQTETESASVNIDNLNESKVDVESSIGSIEETESSDSEILAPPIADYQEAEAESEPPSSEEAGLNPNNAVLVPPISEPADYPAE